MAVWNARVKTCTKTMVVETDPVGRPNDDDDDGR